MDKLLKGVQKFKEKYYKEHKDMYSELAKGQSPEVLLFACSDSRVDPNLIAQSEPGEIFVVRNVGNIIPACNPHWKKSCTAAAIEFCLLMLKISEIIVCGHSDCGALKALYQDPKELDAAPNLKDWLESAKPVKEVLDRNNSEPSFKSRLEMTAKEHILMQIENLKTYPLVAKALSEERLTLHGWYYDIGTGAVHVFNRESNEFKKIPSTYGVSSSDAEEGELYGTAKDV
jgi:carbonic anhydrase